MSAERSGAGKTIVVADDDPEIVGSITTYLTRLGYRVLPCADGEAALKAIEESRPDLAVLDIAMPKASGIVLVRQVRSHPDLALRQIPVIMLTAKSDTRHEAYSDEAGVNAFVPKPVKLGDLAKKIKALL